MKVAIVGAGQVGATAALHILREEVNEVVLVDSVEGLAHGKALDLGQSAAISGYSCRIRGTSDIAAIEAADIVVVTAGFPRLPGMDRTDLLSKNISVLREVSEAIRLYAPGAVVINVTNPLDVLCFVLMKLTGLPRERILGMAGLLDTARLRSFLAEELGVSRCDVTGLVIGGHGDTMVPLLKNATVGGVPVQSLLSEEAIEKVIVRTVNAGKEIVSLYKRGGAFYAPGAACGVMVKAILNDEKRIFPCSVYLEGEYGLKDIFLGVPVRLGGGGVEEVIEFELSAREMDLLRLSAEKTAKAISEAMRLVSE